MDVMDIRPRSIGRELLSVLIRVGAVVLSFFLIIFSINAVFDAEFAVSDGSCNIAVLPVEGVIVPFSGLADYPLAITPKTVEEFMDTVEDERAIDGVLIEINSPGGTPVAAERIAERLRSSPLPVVGLVGDLGASGGYLVAAASDVLLASPMSSIGSIGVTMSYVEESEKNEEEGRNFVELNTGEFKDAGNPNKPLTEAERDLFERNLNAVFDQFVSLVARYRGMGEEAVRELADGSTMAGVEALDTGLIDQLGGRAEARNAFARILDIDSGDVTFCEYENALWLF